MSKFIISNIADIILIDTETGKTLYGGQTQSRNIDENTHEVIDIGVGDTYGQERVLTMGISKEDIKNNTVLNKLLNKEENENMKNIAEIVKEVESQNPINVFPTNNEKSVSESTILKNKASIVIIPTVYDGVYVIDKNRKGDEGRELSLLEALSVLEKEDEVVLHLENGKTLRNF